MVNCEDIQRTAHPPDARADIFSSSGRVYTDFFHLSGIPFSITPDPDFLFLSETHQSVLERLHYGIQSRMGCMLLTGEVGTGKTTLCRVLLDQLEGKAQTVYVINPSLSGRELLACILDDLGITHKEETSKKELIDRLNRFLLAHESARPLVIIIDDAQSMPLDTLEDLRLLSNLETDKTKLLQMLLVGQPELLDQLSRAEMRQLKQRVTIHCVLDSLTPDEVRGYVDRRLFIAGNQGQVRFSSGIFEFIHKQSGGIPRLINKICDLSMTAAYVAGSRCLELCHVRAACRELIDFQSRGASGIRSNGSFTIFGRPLVLLITGIVMGAGLIAGAYFYLGRAGLRSLFRIPIAAGAVGSGSISEKITLPPGIKLEPVSTPAKSQTVGESS